MGLLHQPHGFDAVHARHVPVHQQQAVGLLGVDGLANHFQRFLAAGGHIGLQAEAAHHARQNVARRGVVVHHQHAQAHQFVGAEHAPGLGFFLQAKMGMKVKHRSLARRAFRPDASAHELDQIFGDRQPESGTTVFARGGGIGLVEGLEQALALLGRHADTGVLHPKMQFHAVCGPGHGFNSHHDLAAFGEFDGVVAQVDQDLAQPQGVAQQRRGDIGCGGEDQLQALVFGFHADQAGKIFHHVFELEGNRFHAHLAGFDFGKIKNVIDDAQQVLSSQVHFFNVVALLVIQFGLQRQVAHADDGIHRGADLVAHVGQKLRLHAGGILGGLAGALDGVEHLAFSRHILQQPDHALAQVEVVQCAAGDAAPEGRAILARQFKLALVGFAPSQSGVGGPAQLVVLGVIQVQQAGGPLKHLVKGVAKELQEAGVGAHNAAVFEQHNARARRLEDGFLLTVGTGQRLGRGLAFADVKHRSKDAGPLAIGAGQAVQDQFNRDLVAELVSPKHLAHQNACALMALALDKAVAQSHVVRADRDGHQHLDGLAEQFARFITKGFFHGGVAQGDPRFLIDHQHAHRRRGKNVAVPGLGGLELRLLLFQVLGLLRQLAGLQLQGVRLRLCFGQQVLRAHIALQHHHARHHGRRELLNELPLGVTGGAEHRQFQHGQHFTALHQGHQNQHVGFVLTQARGQHQVARRHLANDRGFAVGCRLSQQAFAAAELPSQQAVFIKPPAGAKFVSRGIVQVERCCAAAKHGRQQPAHAPGVVR